MTRVDYFSQGMTRDDKGSLEWLVITTNDWDD